MKYIIICVLLVACTSKPSPKSQAMNAIRMYMHDNANDYRSYQPVETNVDSVFNNSNFTGWQISHKYRMKNTYGAVVLEYSLFKTDIDFNNITPIEPDQWDFSHYKIVD